MNVFITGATGFLGRYLLRKFLLDDRIGKVYLLIRSSLKHSSEERLEELLSKIFDAPAINALRHKIVVVEGDFTKEHCGIEQTMRDYLTKNLNIILHCGASTNFSSTLEELRVINVDGTKHLLQFARTCKNIGQLQRIDYVSTAYVAGSKSGVVTETNLVRGQSFANAYEQSKYEAELLIRDSFSDLNITIYRPSIIVGSSHNGYTPHFKVLYWPLQLLTKNYIPFVPGNPRAKLDIVSIDFVGDSIFVLVMDFKTIGSTFHLTCGMGNETVLGEFLNDAFYYSKLKPLKMIPMWIFQCVKNSPLRFFYSQTFWETAELAKVYASYFVNTGLVFDSRMTSKVLACKGIKPPHWSNYKSHILGFCVESNWGKKFPAAEYSYY